MLDFNGFQCWKHRNSERLRDLCKGVSHLGTSQTRTEDFLRLFSDPTDSVPLEYNHVLIMYFFFLGHYRLLRGTVYPGMCVCSVAQLCLTLRDHGL